MVNGQAMRRLERIGAMTALAMAVILVAAIIYGVF
jgi:hypothetical protein